MSGAQKESETTMPQKGEEAQITIMNNDNDSNENNPTSLMVDSATTLIPSKKRQREMLSEEEKKEERKAANRRSAYQSRLRKKLLIEELQSKVARLTESLGVLREENRSLSVQLEGALTENRRLRFLQHHQQQHQQQQQHDGLLSAGTASGLHLHAAGLPSFASAAFHQLTSPSNFMATRSLAGLEGLSTTTKF